MTGMGERGQGIARMKKGRFDRPFLSLSAVPYLPR